MSSDELSSLLESADLASAVSGEQLTSPATAITNYDFETVPRVSGWTRTGWKPTRDFDKSLRAPRKSSNYRELLTAVLAVEEWGDLNRGRRVLIRTDNMTTRSVINTGDTAYHTLEPLARRLHATVVKFDIELAARHIPGVVNGLADGLSRRRYGVADTGDWQFDPVEHHRAARWLQHRLGRD